MEEVVGKRTEAKGGNRKRRKSHCKLKMQPRRNDICKWFLAYVMTHRNQPMRILLNHDSSALRISSITVSHLSFELHMFLQRNLSEQSSRRSTLGTAVRSCKKKNEMHLTRLQFYFFTSPLPVPVDQPSFFWDSAQAQQKAMGLGYLKCFILSSHGACSHNSTAVGLTTFV